MIGKGLVLMLRFGSSPPSRRVRPGCGHIESTRGLAFLMECALEATVQMHRNYIAHKSTRYQLFDPSGNPRIT